MTLGVGRLRPIATGTEAHNAASQRRKREMMLGNGVLILIIRRRLSYIVGAFDHLRRSGLGMSHRRL